MGSNNIQPGSSQNTNHNRGLTGHTIFAYLRVSRPTSEKSRMESVLSRKRDHNDFDTVLIHDLSRLTRAGAQQAMHLLKRFDNAGITVQVAGDPYPINVDTFAAAANILNARDKETKTQNEREQDEER